MLANLRLRLERILNSGADVDTLLEEIISALADETTPADFPAGIQLKSSDGNPPIQIQSDPTDLSGNTPAFSVRRGNQDFGFSLNFENTFTQTGDTTPTVAAAQAGTSTFPGKLTAYHGSNVYQVSIYPNGLSAASSSVRVTQIQGDDTIPHIVDGSVWAMVSRGADGHYTMCLPVWE